MKAWITQLRKGLVEFAVLNLLRAGESYGYQIVQWLKQLDELAVTESTVYPVLARLREDGYVTVRSIPSGEGPPRRYFSLTRLGAARVREMAAYWQDLAAAMTALITQGEAQETREWKSRKQGERRSGDTSTRFGPAWRN